MQKAQVANDAFFAQKLAQINELIITLHQSEQFLGVLNGKAGIALFQFYYGQYLNDEAPADIGGEIISDSIDSINRGFNFPTFCNGIAGLGWTLDHLQQEKLIDIDNDQILSGLDNFLYSSMIADIRQGKFDFLHGAVGYGFYFLKRLRNTQRADLKKRYETYLLELLAYLKHLAVPQQTGIAWKSVLIKEANLQGFNLSLSHGLASIVNFLARVHSVEELKSEAAPLLKKSLDYLLFYKTNHQDSISLFPSWIAPDTDISYNSRLAWCYGDLGIGLTTWHAAQSLEDENLNATACQIFEHAAQRRTPDKSFIKDASICHGAYGVSKIFNRAYHITENPLFKETADYWMDEAVCMAFHEDGLAGYRQFFMEDGKETWENKIGLLEGIAGIGLSIIDYLSDTPHNWDECLMIS
ncbi:hypothetical protein BKI52_01170 [marine bacterium AO1-C]|nr:hypothetical protein BKI52_01170 [marine bacterium AO1-C]